MSSRKQKRAKGKIETDSNKLESKILRYPKVIIFIFLLLTYLQVVGFDFVYLDDDLIILDNHQKISSLQNVPTAFSSQYGFNQGSPYYRPLVTLSFILDAQLAKKSPTLYHITNLLLHFIAAVLLFEILLLLNFPNVISLFAALIFTVHPLLTNAVVWIVGRNDLLVGIFCLASFLFFIQYLNGRKNKYFVYHFITFLLGMLSKETAILLPVICLAYLYLFSRADFNYKFTAKFLVVWFGLGLLYYIIRSNVVVDTKNLIYGIPALIENIPSIPDVLSKIFFPFDIPVLPTFSMFKVILGLLFLVTLLVIPFVIRDISKKMYLFGLFWFFALMIPGLFVLYSNQNERFSYLDTRSYLPFIGILISLNSLFIKKLTINFSSLIARLLPVIILLAVLTFFQSKKYENAIVFAQSAIESNPEKAFFYQKLADYYFSQNQFDNAVVYLEKTIEKSPNSYQHHKNLALAYYSLGNQRKALESLESSFRLQPRDFEVLSALIRINYQLNQFDRSLYYADKVIEFGGSVDSVLYNDLKSMQKNK